MPEIRWRLRAENGRLVLRRADAVSIRVGEDMAAFVARLRGEHGLPAEIDDPAMLDKIAVLLTAP